MEKTKKYDSSLSKLEQRKITLEKKPYIRASKQLVLLFVNIMVKLLEISKLTQAGLKELLHIFKIGILPIIIEFYSDQVTLTVVLRLLTPKSVR